MAVKSFIASNPQNHRLHQIYTVTMNQNDTCAPLDLANHTGDRSIHFSGTFAAASIALTGSNEPLATNGVVLHDIDGNIIAGAALSLVQIKELTAGIIPVITGGDGTTAITISIFAG